MSRATPGNAKHKKTRRAAAAEVQPMTPFMTADQMRRQDRQVRMLEDAVAAQKRRAHVWPAMAKLTIVPATPAHANPEDD